MHYFLELLWSLEGHVRPLHFGSCYYYLKDTCWVLKEGIFVNSSMTFSPAFNIAMGGGGDLNSKFPPKYKLYHEFCPQLLVEIIYLQFVNKNCILPVFGKIAWIAAIFKCGKRCDLI